VSADHLEGISRSAGGISWRRHLGGGGGGGAGEESGPAVAEARVDEKRWGG